jgi:hypothetical protein
MPFTRLERLARASFRAILHLYPAAYRDEYGKEMTLVFIGRLRGRCAGSCSGSGPRIRPRTP